MATVNKYRLFCIEENTYVYEWDTVEPTICPNDHADKSINTSLTTIVDNITADKVQVEEDSNGYFETTHLLFDIPSGTPGDITEYDISWPMDILLWKTLLTPTTDMIGDTITVVASPEATIGVLAAPINIGDTTFTVNSTVIDNAYRGFLVTIDDGVNKDVLGRCIAIDSVNSTISVETAASYAFAAGTPVKVSVYTIKDLYITDTTTIDIAAKGIKGKTVTAGMVMRVYYTNNSGTAKIFRWRIEFYNDG